MNGEPNEDYHISHNPQSKRVSEEKYAEADSMLKDLLELDDGLTSWEVGFIENMAEQFDEEAFCTIKQYEKLKQIWDDRA